MPVQIAFAPYVVLAEPLIQHNYNQDKPSLYNASTFDCLIHMYRQITGLPFDSSKIQITLRPMSEGSDRKIRAVVENNSIDDPEYHRRHYLVYELLNINDWVVGTLFYDGPRTTTFAEFSQYFYDRYGTYFEPTDFEMTAMTDINVESTTQSTWTIVSDAHPINFVTNDKVGFWLRTRHGSGKWLPEMYLPVIFTNARDLTGGRALDPLTAVASVAVVDNNATIDVTVSGGDGQYTSVITLNDLYWPNGVGQLTESTTQLGPNLFRHQFNSTETVTIQRTYRYADGSGGEDLKQYNITLNVSAPSGPTTLASFMGSDVSMDPPDDWTDAQSNSYEVQNFPTFPNTSPNFPQSAINIAYDGTIYIRPTPISPITGSIMELPTFTLQLWVEFGYVAMGGPGMHLIGSDGSDSVGWNLHAGADGWYWNVNMLGDSESGFIPDDMSAIGRRHVAVIKDNYEINIFLDGMLRVGPLAVGSVIANYGSKDMVIGRKLGEWAGSTTAQLVHLLTDDVKYTTNFTPPPPFYIPLPY